MSTNLYRPPGVAFRFEAQWRVLPGMAHGVNQPVMLGTALVARAGLPDLAALDRAMAQLISEPVAERSRDGSPEVALAQRVLDWVAALQRQLLLPVFRSGHAWRRSNHRQDGKVNVALPYVVPQAASAALAWVAHAVSGFIAHGQIAPLGRERANQELEKLTARFRNFRPQGVNRFRFLKAADVLDVAVRRLAPEVYCFGQGRHSRWLESSYTDRTSVVGARIARNKFSTATVLRQAGFPAPKHALAASPEQALQIARQLGFPVVVKPVDRDQGLGVAADLRDDAAVISAYHEAAKYSSSILVEKHFHGKDYRLTVFNGRLVKATLRLPGGVTGDGRLSVTELVELAKKDPHNTRRARERGRNLLELDQEALELLSGIGMTPQSVPPAGHYVCLRRRANISAGGSSFNVQQPIHPDNRRLAERAAEALRLDLAGVDLIIPDISSSWLETGALVCEVNGQPQIGIGTSPGIYVDILRELMQGHTRIPVALVVDDNSYVAEQLTRRWQSGGLVVGHSSVDGVWQGLERIATAQPGAFVAGQILMANPAIEAAVVVLTPAQIVLLGLPFDRCDVLILAPPDATTASWTHAELMEMWRMVLPHVKQAIITTKAGAQLLPEAPQLQARGLSVLQCSGEGEALAEAAAGLLMATGSAP